MRPPNILKLGRYCDASVVQRWISEKDLRETVGPGRNQPPHPFASPHARGHACTQKMSMFSFVITGVQTTMPANPYG